MQIKQDNFYEYVIILPDYLVFPIDSNYIRKGYRDGTREYFNAEQCFYLYSNKFIKSFVDSWNFNFDFCHRYIERND